MALARIQISTLDILKLIVNLIFQSFLSLNHFASTGKPKKVRLNGSNHFKETPMSISPGILTGLGKQTRKSSGQEQPKPASSIKIVDQNVHGSNSLKIPPNRPRQMIIICSFFNQQLKGRNLLSGSNFSYLIIRGASASLSLQKTNDSSF